LRLLLEETCVATSAATTVGAALTVETREDRAPCGSATTTVAAAVVHQPHPVGPRPNRRWRGVELWHACEWTQTIPPRIRAIAFLLSQIEIPC
jgi:hypothetical protein